MFCSAGVASLLLDVLAQMQCGGNGDADGSGPSSLLLLGPPGVGKPLRQTTF